MPTSKKITQPSLTAFVEPTRWQRIQDHLARVLNIPIRTVGLSRELLVPASWPASLTHDHAISLLNAGDELEQLIPANQPPQDCASITTRLGATYTVVPIRPCADFIAAYVVIGPVVVGVREDELNFRQRVHAMGLDASSLWPVMLSLKLFSFSSLQAILSLIEEVGTQIAENAWQVHALSLSQALLDAAIAATRADGGSIMHVDDSGEHLEISAAYGLPEEVLGISRVPRRETLAGFAVEEGRPLIIDDTTTDSRLRSRMRQQKTISSILFPLIKNGGLRPTAVLNLRSVTEGKRFSQEDVNLLSRLLRLISARFSA